MENVLLVVIAVVMALDVITNLFMLLFSPSWTKRKAEELELLRDQNRVLWEYLREYREEEE